MTTEEFIQALNEETATLGLRPVTERAVRDWVDERLIRPRKPKGRRRGCHPLWLFSEEDLRWAKIILKLKPREIRRVAELRLHLWITDDSYPVEKVIGALRSEFGRLMRRNRRTLRFKYDHRHQKRLSEEDEQKYARQLSPIDPTLAAAGFKMETKSTLDAMSELLWGKAGQERFPQIIASETAHIFGSLIPSPNSQLSGQNPPPLDLSNFAGLFGAVDEISGSGEKELTRISEADLLEARRKLREFISALSIPDFGQFTHLEPAYRTAAATFTRTEWVVSTLAAFGIQAGRKRIKSK